MSSEEIVFEIADGIATIRLNRPERMNAFTYEMIDRWAEHLGVISTTNDHREAVAAFNEKRPSSFTDS